MTWPVKQEAEWRLFISDLMDSDHGFYLVIYDRQFTCQALLSRLESEFSNRHLHSPPLVPLSERITAQIKKELSACPLKAVCVHLTAELNELHALNFARESLYNLPVNLVFLADTDVHSVLLTSARDLVTWIRLPYSFNLQKIKGNDKVLTAKQIS